MISLATLKLSLMMYDIDLEYHISYVGTSNGYTFVSDYKIPCFTNQNDFSLDNIYLFMNCIEMYNMIFITPYSKLGKQFEIIWNTEIDDNILLTFHHEGMIYDD